MGNLFLNRIDRLKKHLLKAERNALDLWEKTQINPTLVVFLVVFALFFMNLGISAIFHPLPWWALAILFFAQTLLVYLMFTPAHESVHRIASKKRWLNESMLIGCWPIFLNNPYVFRRLHIIHHTKTNIPGEDPDRFTEGRSLVERTARSFLLIPYYYWFAAGRFRESWKDYLHNFLSILTPLVVVAAGFFMSMTEVALWTWLFPAYIGMGLLSFTNTTWVHHPGVETDRYKNTRAILVPRWLQILMLNQNLHLVHHLRPSLPWYKYPEYFAQNAHKLVSLGGKISTFTKRKNPHSLL